MLALITLTDSKQNNVDLSKNVISHDIAMSALTETQIILLNLQTELQLPTLNINIAKDNLNNYMNSIKEILERVLTNYRHNDVVNDFIVKYAKYNTWSAPAVRTFIRSLLSFVNIMHNDNFNKLIDSLVADLNQYIPNLSLVLPSAINNKNLPTTTPAARVLPDSTSLPSRVGDVVANPVSDQLGTLVTNPVTFQTMIEKLNSKTGTPLTLNISLYGLCAWLFGIFTILCFSLYAGDSIVIPQDIYDEFARYSSNNSELTQTYEFDMLNENKVCSFKLKNNTSTLICGIVLLCIVLVLILLQILESYKQIADSRIIPLVLIWLFVGLSILGGLTTIILLIIAIVATVNKNIKFNHITQALAVRGVNYSELEDENDSTFTLRPTETEETITKEINDYMRWMVHIFDMNYLWISFACVLAFTAICTYLTLINMQNISATK
jgi:hypothetical protein